MGRVLSLAVFSMAVWLLWSGHYTSLLIAFGVVSSVFVALTAKRMNVADAEGHPVHLLFRLVFYVPWLVWAIFKSNIDIALRILNPGLPISPRLIKVKTSQKTDLGRVIYANSITLTPGTVTVDVEGDEFTVHALTRGTAEDLESGDMDRRVTRAEGES